MLINHKCNSIADVFTPLLMINYIKRDKVTPNVNERQKLKPNQEHLEPEAHAKRQFTAISGGS